MIVYFGHSQTGSNVTLGGYHLYVSTSLVVAFEQALAASRYHGGIPMVIEIDTSALPEFFVVQPDSKRFENEYLPSLENAEQRKTCYVIGGMWSELPDMTFNPNPLPVTGAFVNRDGYKVVLTPHKATNRYFNVLRWVTNPEGRDVSIFQDALLEDFIKVIPLSISEVA